MKRKMFIGSSSEGLKIAEAIRTNLENQCGDWIDVVIWNGGDIFALNTGTLESLIKESMICDYAVLVATNDDKTTSRGKGKKVARDNVILEAGLFLGALGKSRTYLVADEEIELPSDFNGTMVIICKNETASINDVCNKIVVELKKTQHSYQLKHLPSAALALGYFDNYVLHFFKNRKSSYLKVIIPTSFESIEGEVVAYKSKYASKDYSTRLFKRSRPIGYKYKKRKNVYWDIPTTMQTIYKLVEKIIPQTEIGNNPERDRWLEKEAYVFGHTLEELIAHDKICKDRVEVVFL